MGKMQKELIHEILKSKVGYVFNFKDCADIEDLILSLWFILENEKRKFTLKEIEKVRKNG